MNKFSLIILIFCTIFATAWCKTCGCRPCGSDEVEKPGVCSEPSCDPINPAKVTNGCVCKCGLVRYNGKCIRPCDCPPKCGCDEVFKCKGAMEPSCDPKNPVKSENGCVCKDGLVRYNGKCIKPCDCPPKCGCDEVFKCKGTMEPSCDPKNPVKSDNGCVCKDGLVRYNGKCIKPCDCPPKCGCDEVFKCKGSMEPSCDPKKPVKSENGCVCKDGLVRYNGKCIKPCNCPPKCRCDEVFKCKDAMEPTCDTKKPVKSENGCVCKDGLVRHNGKCIKKCDCPPCGFDKRSDLCDCNEVMKCKGTMEPTCNPNKQVKSENGCVCKDGFVKHNGKCIKPCDCPPKCGCDEVFKCKGTMEPSCDPKNPVKSENGCVCKDGLVRYNGKCIKPCDCPPKCGRDEVFKCKGAMEPSCDPKKPVKSDNGCVCRDGLVRYNGKCIKPCDCPSKCGCDEVFKCKGAMEPSCDPKKPVKSDNGCVCKDGLVRHNGKCIKPCDYPPKCGCDEVFKCKGAMEPSCDPNNPVKSENGCVCRDGLVRYNGKCIKPCDCPPKCGCDEVFKCKGAMEPSCDPKKHVKSVNGCVCKDGLVRHNGICIKPCNCPPPPCGCK